MCIELSENEELNKSMSSKSTLLLTKILEPTLTIDEENLDLISSINHRVTDDSAQSALDSTALTLNTNCEINGNW